MIHPLGITVMPEYPQSEGIDRVLDNIAGLARATSITTSPYVAALAPEGVGDREPPGDAGLGKKRLLDRALWGRRELWMTAAPSFVPDVGLYDGLRYRPPDATELTRAEGATVGRFLDAARDRGVETWLQVQAAMPPCIRVTFGGPLPGDEPLLPDGRVLRPRVDNNASLAAPDLRAYLRALTQDLWRNYPQVDGLKFDWPEYPCYHFDALFFDFSPHVAPIARAAGFDMEGIAAGVRGFLAELGNGAARHKKIALDGFDGFRDSLFAAYPALEQMIALRRAVVTDFAAALRAMVDEASKGECKLFLPGFPPPLSTGTGADLAALAPHCDGLGIKMYTMHWPLIEADFLKALTTRADFAPAQVALALSRIMALSPATPRDPAAILYPGPDEAHPAASTDLAAKMAAARIEAPGVWAMAHGYGPLDDVMRRYDAVADGPVQMNRYGYLSDEKLAAMGARRS
ncbi:hypothetical protein [Oceaniovalibus sp. ACAM 378]|uniref:hypothetical protein n=1 Tax=Oceaniovalibus sp. ACAM 378 TaxID=2599923 RepID=UPI0011D33BD3|nr:hypothetical protein [Oceaniovalibus sp. ACAM 378]TYB90530.1 hypothetical protein FQ320_02360 [Oceaniovalibus sp. ACAM 378]